MPWLFTLVSVVACVGTWALARFVARARREGRARSPWETAGLVALALGVGIGAGLFGPVGVVAAVSPSTSYEAVLPVWLVTLPGVPLLLVWAVVRALRAG